MTPQATTAGWRIVLTLWAGSLWTAGFIIAPMLFAVLDDRAVAGRIAGEMFTAVGWTGLACLILLLSFEALRFGAGMWRRWTTGLLTLALLATIAGHFVVRPWLSSLPVDAAVYGTLHGLASALHLGLSVIALVLVTWQEEGPLRRDE